jgi:lipopolysaccharide/colanic/teichoic acid biosynthesis glycosyltransferase
MTSLGTFDTLEIEREIPLTREHARADTRARELMPRNRRKIIDRAVNVLIAGTALILVSPLLLVLAVLVKLTSRGPVFYSQPRVGIDRRRTTDRAQMYDRRTRDLGGLPFTIYKFRTMFTGAEKPNGAVWATKGDPRVTPLGGIMRKLRLDELPQLVNVVRGDMNIVGPRPERPSWAQINQSYDTSLDDVRRKVRFDLEYLERQGIREDLLIMAKTVPVMLFRKGGW